jgi:hypothetical protein
VCKDRQASSSSSIFIIIVPITDEKSTVVRFDLAVEEQFYEVAYTNLPNGQWSYQFSVLVPPMMTEEELPASGDIIMW